MSIGHSEAKISYTFTPPLVTSNGYVKDAFGGMFTGVVSNSKYTKSL